MCSLAGDTFRRGWRCVPVKTRFALVTRCYSFAAVSDPLADRIRALRETIADFQRERRRLVALATDPHREQILGPVVAAIDEALAVAQRDLEAFERAGHPERLTVQRSPRTVKRRVTSAQQQAISERLGGSDANLRAARKAGIPSLRQLARALGVSVSFLSQVRAGNRPMPEERKAKFRAITGEDWQ